MRTIGLVLILGCATSLPLSGQGGNAEAAVRTVEHNWFEAQSRNDNRALDLIFDNALVYIESGRLMTKGEYLLSIKSAGPQPQQIVTEAMTVRVFGGTAIVVGTYRETGVKDRKPLLKRWRFVDTWVKKNGSWMLVAAAAAPLPK